MSKLTEREARRKQSIVGSMINEDDQKQTTEEQKRKSVSQERVQRAYWLDKDIDKALKRKSLEEEKNLTEIVNEVLRASLAGYL